MKKIRRKLVAVSGVLCISLCVTGQSPSPGWFTRANTETGLVVTPGNQELPCVADINNDGYPDLMSLYIAPGGTLYSERKPMMIHLNIQNPDSSDSRSRKFIDVTPQSGVHDIPGDTGYHANCFTLADFNNDGNVDLVTGNFYYNKATYPYPNDRCQVFLGDGTGKFTYKPNNGLSVIGLRNIRALTALDYDRDGNLDLFIATFYENPSAGLRDHAYLLKGNGDGTFTDLTDVSGVGALPEAMYGSSATDWNNDCYPDIFTAPYCRSPGMILRNNAGDGTFTNMASSLGYNLELTGAGQRSCTFAITPEDVNNDGNMDLFFAVVHGGNSPGQFRSTIGINKGPDHNYSFDIREDLLPVNSPASSHRGDMKGVFMDFDNDGLKDLVMAQAIYMPATDRTYFWRQQPDHSFTDVTAALGLLVPEMKSTTFAEVIDYDMDGDDDLLVTGPDGGALVLWKNNVGQNKNRIMIHAQPMSGYGINRSGIGTRIYVYYGGKMQMREVMAGRGMHTGQQPFILNFGLGDATSVDSVVIRWPDANCTRKVIYNPPINTRAVVNSFPAGMEDVKPAVAAVRVFPNPTARYVVVQGDDLTDHIREARLVDISGKSANIHYSTSDGDKLIFDLESLPAGVYFVQLKFNDGRQESYKITRSR